MFENGKVLLATDFSKTADKLTDCLLELERTGIEEVLLVHVVDARKSGGTAIAFKENNEQELLRLKNKVEEMGLKADVKVSIGHPDNEIIKIAEEEDCQLILVASHGGGIIKQLFLGNTAYNIIRKSRVAVLVEKYKNIEEGQLACERKFDRVLLPIDFSECADKAKDMLKKMHQASNQIILLSVIETSDDLEELKNKKEEAIKKLKLIQQEFEAEKIDSEISIKVREGIASDNIIAIAEEEEAGLILMSKRGQGLIKNLLLGSTADRVARRSPIPVLFVPCEED